MKTFIQFTASAKIPIATVGGAVISKEDAKNQIAAAVLAVVALSLSASFGAVGNNGGKSREMRECAKEFARFEAKQKTPVLGPQTPQTPQEIHFYRTEEGFIMVNEMMTTSGRHYPTAMVQQALGLDEEELRRLPRGAKILSLGEGMSDLIPSLRNDFPNAFGLDIWYDTKPLPRELADYVSKNRSALITGSAMSIPLPSNSQDLVVSHALLSSIKGREIGQALSESLRVLKPGGVARHAYCCIYLEDEVAALRRQYGSAISVKIEPYHVNWMYAGRRIDQVGQRVVIQRLK